MIASEHFSDTYRLLHTGYLQAFMKAGDTRFVLRSLSDLELSEVRIRSWGGDLLEQFSFLLAYSIQYVNGRQILLSDAKWQLAQQIRLLPHPILLRLLLVVRSLRNQAINARAGVLPFSFEPLSRELWVQTKVKGLVSHHEAQALWGAINSIEDLRLQDLKQWQWVKLLSAPHVSKDIRKRFDSTEKQETQERESHRANLLMAWISRLTGELPQVSKPITVNGVPLAKDADDLVDEMLRWVRGEKDQHDLIIEAEKEKIRQLALSSVRANAARQDALEDSEFDDVPLVVLTPGEVERRLAEVKTSRIIDVAPLVDTDRLSRFDDALKKARADGLSPANLVNPLRGGL